MEINTTIKLDNYYYLHLTNFKNNKLEYKILYKKNNKYYNEEHKNFNEDEFNHLHIYKEVIDNSTFTYKNKLYIKIDCNNLEKSPQLIYGNYIFQYNNVKNFIEYNLNSFSVILETTELVEKIIEVDLA